MIGVGKTKAVCDIVCVVCVCFVGVCVCVCCVCVCIYGTSLFRDNFKITPWSLGTGETDIIRSWEENNYDWKYCWFHGSCQNYWHFFYALFPAFEFDIAKVSLTSGIELQKLSESEIWRTGHQNTRFCFHLFFVQSLFTEKGFKKSKNCQPNVFIYYRISFLSYF